MPALKLTIAATVAATFALGACTNPDGSNNNQGTGALLGAATGAIFGQAVSASHPERGRVLGAVAGAIVGGAIGDNLDKQEAELRADLGGSGARIVNTGDQLIVTLPEAITFDFDSAVLHPQFVDSVRDIARSLQNYPDTIVEVIGHTDNVGSPSYNDNLSQARAQSVANVLINSGVRSSRIEAYGLGERRPVASNATASGRQANRRVEIVITPRR